MRAGWWKRLAVVAAVSLSPFSVGLAEASTNTTCGVRPSDSLVSSLRQQAPSLKSEVLRLALGGSMCAAQEGLVKRQNLLTVIDYSMPSTEPRLFVFDLNAKRLLFRELVAHGRNSGGNLTNFFSNLQGSFATSIGLFVTADTYFGGNGYSLRLKGLDEGFNDSAWSRAIVMHGAPYVNNATAKALGRLGRSLGCPAVRPQIAKQLIDTVKGGSPIFAYYPDSKWMRLSKWLNRNEPVSVAAGAR